MYGEGDEYGVRAAKHQRDVRFPGDRKGKGVEGRRYLESRLSGVIPQPRFNLKSFFRVFSLNLCSAILGFNIVMNVLVQRGPKSDNIIDNRLNFLISVPVAGVAFLWELTSFLLGYARQLPRRHLLVDVAAEAILAIGAAMSAIVAAFQASRHQAYNSTTDGPQYEDVGLEIALAVLLGCLMVSSLGVKALSVIEWNKRKCGTWDRYGVSPVNEIIP
ncbi:hypothetical protein GQ53DRAFT_742161 [Thozetella sp. PMI_491]|nr:hypothetical protein GQ53DRAFT_742161 [Thozetella sp. PMI_491]